MRKEQWIFLFFSVGGACVLFTDLGIDIIPKKES